MKGSLLRMYHALPAPGRSAVASARGLYLRSWRYGPETDALTEAALDRESWSASQWKGWQEERLSRVLHRAATQVPYYRDLWARRRAGGDGASWEYLENWPILTKEPVRTNGPAFVADDCQLRRMYMDQTSGTTGTPLRVWLSRETVRNWYAIHEARNRRWNGVSREDAWAILGGQPVVPTTVRKPPFWVWNSPMKQLYLSANHLSPRTVAAYVDALRGSAVTHLIAYSSAATDLARAVGEAGLAVPALRVVITNAEPLYSWQRETIQRGLGCPVRETYGMAEIVAGASACSEGRLHTWPEIGSLEILDDTEDRAAAAGAPGRMVCTALLNADMPLVRYAVGDRALGGEKEAALCACGRRLPTIDHVEGRMNDVLISPDGRRIYWVNPVFYGLPIQEAQIVQEALDTVRVRYVAGISFDDSARDAIQERLKMRMGEVRILFQAVPKIERGRNGKFRAVICRIPESSLAGTP